MREQDELRGDTLSPIIVDTKRHSKFIAANIIDPNDGTVHFHIVSTKWFNVLAVTVITLFLCGLTMLALVVYLKTSVDQNSQEIQDLKDVKEVETNVNNSQDPDRR